MRDDVGNQAMDSGRAARIREAQVSAAQELGGGIGGALSDKLSPMCGSNEKCAQEPLRYRVESRLQRISNNAEGLLRIQAILSEHPEFEKFLEFQHLLNRHNL